MRFGCLTLWFLVSSLSMPEWQGDVQKPPRMVLRLEEEIEISNAFGGPHLPVKCDTGANIYVRFDVGSPFTTPVTKVTPRGEVKARFSLDQVSKWNPVQFYDYDVGPGGEVYLLAARMGKDRKVEYAILTMSEDGKHRDTIPIRSPSVTVDRMAAFSTGEFLLAGWKTSAASQTSTGKNDQNSPSQAEVQPVLLVVNLAGDVVREVRMSEKADGEAATEAEPSPITLLSKSAISLARTVRGDDGNIYILFRAEKPFVVVVSPNLTAVHRLDVAPPEKDAQMLDLRYASGFGLIVQFARPSGERRWDTGNAILSLVNYQTGERLMDYQSSREAGGAFACYAPGSFLFLTTREGKSILRRAAPR